MQLLFLFIFQLEVAAFSIGTEPSRRSRIVGPGLGGFGGSIALGEGVVYVGDPAEGGGHGAVYQCTIPGL